MNKGLSSLYLNFINNNNIIKLINNNNITKLSNDNNTDIKSLHLVELISVYMQIIDDFSDYKDDKLKGIKTSINILDDLKIENKKVETQMWICLDLLLQIGNLIMDSKFKNIKKEKKDGLFITLLQHWIYSCFKNQELLNENIGIEVIKKWYFLKDINYLLEKRATKMDYVFRLLENINFCK